MFRNSGLLPVRIAAGNYILECGIALLESTGIRERYIYAVNADANMDWGEDENVNSNSIL